jgi:hypothetical protein
MHSLLFGFGISLLVVAQARVSVDEMVGLHNGARAAVGLPPVSWSEALKASAMAAVAKCPTGHNPADLNTENLSWGWPTLSTAAVFKMWDAEKQFYNAATNGCIGGAVCGHYVNIIMNTEIGCASMQCSNIFGQTSVTAYACHYRTEGSLVISTASTTVSPGGTAESAGSVHTRSDPIQSVALPSQPIGLGVADNVIIGFARNASSVKANAYPRIDIQESDCDGDFMLNEGMLGAVDVAVELVSNDDDCDDDDNAVRISNPSNMFMNDAAGDRDTPQSTIYRRSSSIANYL